MDELLKLFAVARAFVEAGFSEDLEWSRNLVELPTLDEITLQEFYREYAFVVYCHIDKLSCSPFNLVEVYKCSVLVPVVYVLNYRKSFEIYKEGAMFKGIVLFKP